MGLGDLHETLCKKEMTGDAAHQHSCRQLKKNPVSKREKPLDLIGASQLVSGSCSESMPYHYINYIYIYIYMGKL